VGRADWNAYAEEAARAVAVQAGAIVDCQHKVYGASALGHELEGIGQPR
jgi:hypothetical protein